MLQIRKICVLLLAFCGLTMMKVSAQDNAFVDISDHWAEGTIIKWQDSGLINGYPDGTFKPDAPISRAEFAKVIALAFALPKTEPQDYAQIDPHDTSSPYWEFVTPSDYTDLDSEAWYYPYMERASVYIPVYPLTMGYESNEPYVANRKSGKNGFLPNSYLIRAHAAEALARVKTAQENKDIEFPNIYEIQTELEGKFNDTHFQQWELFNALGQVARNAERMFQYVWLANNLGIMEGDADGYFNPYGYLTRAELITVVDRMTSSINLKE